MSKYVNVSIGFNVVMEHVNEVQARLDRFERRLGSDRAFQRYYHWRSLISPRVCRWCAAMDPDEIWRCSLCHHRYCFQCQSPTLRNADTVPNWESHGYQVVCLACRLTELVVDGEEWTDLGLLITLVEQRRGIDPPTEEE